MFIQKDHLFSSFSSLAQYVQPNLIVHCRCLTIFIRFYFKECHPLYKVSYCILQGHLISCHNIQYKPNSSNIYLSQTLFIFYYNSFAFSHNTYWVLSHTHLHILCSSSYTWYYNLSISRYLHNRISIIICFISRIPTTSLLHFLSCT